MLLSSTTKKYLQNWSKYGNPYFGAKDKRLNNYLVDVHVTDGYLNGKNYAPESLKFRFTGMYLDSIELTRSGEFLKIFNSDQIIHIDLIKVENTP